MGEGEGEGEAFGEGEGEGEAFGEGEGEALGEGDGEGEAEGLGEAFGEGEGDGLEPGPDAGAVPAGGLPEVAAARTEPSTKAHSSSARAATPTRGRSERSVRLSLFIISLPILKVVWPLLGVSKPAKRGSAGLWLTVRAAQSEIHFETRIAVCSRMGVVRDDCRGRACSCRRAQ